MIKFTITNDTISVIADGKVHSINDSAPNFKPLREALISGNESAVLANLTVSKSLNDWARGKFTFEGQTLKYDGKAVPEGLSKRALTMATEGKSPEAFFKFWEKLQLNPSWRSVQQLWGFLENVGIPLTDDGDFLAYKAVDKDYLDKYTHKISNVPGQVNKMPRNQISDDPELTCHYGLHVGALAYAQGYYGTGDNDKLVVVKVSPENVVCVPVDFSAQKMRVCEYEVLGNYGIQLPSTVFNNDTVTPPTVADFDTSDEAVNDDASLPDDDKLLGEDAEGEAFDSKEDPIVDLYGDENKMSTKELYELTLDHLRKYAAHGLKIVGASKIPGGKINLIKRIVKVRK